MPRLWKPDEQLTCTGAHDHLLHGYFILDLSIREDSETGPAVSWAMTENQLFHPLETTAGCRLQIGTPVESGILQDTIVVGDNDEV